MLAAFYTRQGPAREVLTVDEVSLPTPRANEVRVRVHASGINPADVKRRSGQIGRSMLFPIVIPHSDGAGVIDAVGARVSSKREGERVWLWNTQWNRPFGTAAQYTTIPSEQAVHLDDAASFDLGASLGVPALTAHRCVSILGDLRSKRVFIFGGAGTVGQFVIQFAKIGGAVVTAAVRSTAKAQVARHAGADEILNQSTAEFLDQAIAASGSRGFDHIIEVDFAANWDIYTRVLSKHGSVVIFGSATDMEPCLAILPFQLHGITLHLVSGSEQPPDMRELALRDVSEAIAAGRLHLPIENGFNLCDIAAAHESIEAQTAKGKVVLTI